MKSVEREREKGSDVDETFYAAVWVHHILDEWGTGRSVYR